MHTQCINNVVELTTCQTFITQLVKGLIPIIGNVTLCIIRPFLVQFTDVFILSTKLIENLVAVRAHESRNMRSLFVPV